MNAVRYTFIPKADLKAKRYLVTANTPRANALGLRDGDVIEMRPDGARLLSYVGEAPPRKYLDSLIVSGTLVPLEPAA